VFFTAPDRLQWAPHLALLLFLLAHCPAHAQPAPPAGPAPLTFSHTVAQPYGGDLSEENAHEAAAVLARHALVDMVARWLASRPQLDGAFEEISARPVADALVEAHITGSEFFGYEDDAGAAVTMETALHPEKTVLQATVLLSQPMLLHLYAACLKREQHILNQFVALAAARRSPADRAPGREAAFNRHIRSLRSMRIYRQALPLLQADGVWQAPETVVETMREAIDKDGLNPLPWNALGEARFQLGQTLEAAGDQDTALRLDPAFARAWHSRGTTYLKLHLPELAVEDYSAAISLAPQMAQFRQSRGAAYLVLKNFSAMCEDYRTACGLGRCESLHWARTRNYCTAPRSADTTAQ